MSDGADDKAFAPVKEMKEMVKRPRMDGKRDDNPSDSFSTAIPTDESSRIDCATEESSHYPQQLQQHLQQNQTDTILESEKCWKCLGYGRKKVKNAPRVLNKRKRKELKQRQMTKNNKVDLSATPLSLAGTLYVGPTCPVCKGSGRREASQRSQVLSQQDGQILKLRGREGIFEGVSAIYHEHECSSHSESVLRSTDIPSRKVTLYVRPKNTSSTDDKSQAPSLTIPVYKGEIVGSLGCGNWRLFQLANGHKLTVDDFLCAWVAAEEVRHQGWADDSIRYYKQKQETTGLQLAKRGHYVEEPLAPTSFSRDKDLAYYGNAPIDNKVQQYFHHADIGCGCGSVLMMMAWAFPQRIKSHGVEAQAVSLDLCRRGLQWNLGLAATSTQASHHDLRSWKGGELAPFDIITGTPPYFPKDKFVASENHAQKIRCRVPTRGAASDYIVAASRLIKPNGIICVEETARVEGEEAILETIARLPLRIKRRVDIITRAGLPPRFSVWVLQHLQDNTSLEERREMLFKRNFQIELFTIRDIKQIRTLQYVRALEQMGWVDFENSRERLK